jgi:proteasome lid subunit RPN8/RPN11
MEISQSQLQSLIDHATESAPIECCGYIRLTDGRVDEVFRGENTKNSPYAFDLDGKSLIAANELEDEGFGVAIYHSHPRSAAEPSQTDINVAQYPGWLYFIVSLAGEPDVRAWKIADGRVEEEPLNVS